MKLSLKSSPVRNLAAGFSRAAGGLLARGIFGLGLMALLACRALVAAPSPFPGQEDLGSQSYPAAGVVEEVKADGKSVVIKHDAIPGYMAAMTMPFHVKGPDALAGIRAGDEIAFRLHVTGTESWIDGITKTGKSVPPAPPPPAADHPARATHPLLTYHFTNELGQAVSLNDFRGQALAITFFFTRCPIPDYCPRLSKNFQQAAQKLAARPDAPVNWHFLSVSFDPEFDTPAVLRAYATRYGYDPGHWSFLTGPRDKITELAKQSDVTFQPDGGFISHNFRTLVIDANGKLQMMFPVGGDLSDALVQEILKAVKVPRPPELEEKRPDRAVAVAGH